MGAILSAVIAIAGVVLGWIVIEVACKPCLEVGRAAIDRSLNPDYDPDDAQAPLNPNFHPQDSLDSAASSTAAASDAIKAV